MGGNASDLSASSSILASDARGPTHALAARRESLPCPFGMPDPQPAPTTERMAGQGTPGPPPLREAGGTRDLTGLAASPVKVHAMIPLLQAYPNKLAAQFLLDGFTKGFRIPFAGPRVPTDCGNLKSARDLPRVVEDKINKELQAGRIAGPFSSPPLPNLRVSPVGVVPKKTPGEFRMINHLSYPTGSSVNDGIDPEVSSVRNCGTLAQISGYGHQGIVGTSDTSGLPEGTTELPGFPLGIVGQAQVTLYGRSYPAIPGPPTAKRTVGADASHFYGGSFVSLQNLLSPRPIPLFRCPPGHKRVGQDGPPQAGRAAPGFSFPTQTDPVHPPLCLQVPLRNIIVQSCLYIGILRCL
ncbi:uncharacterized protein LOC125441063 [Sphaerodactylus townsendi]|uniref:uncharacterized protein LOC125441063 n=1 Tax=Sphaerodactylus townsendi TaxID=933632 RepID=UPI0020265BBC|nr:uncharacterized protein LOC125441063 [Sphaerodactylus townsendi]